MDRKVEISVLCQIYGKLLTEKQLNIMDNYYNLDLSLSEIAENEGITRQAVRDIIKKGENKLFEFEEKLLFMKRMLNQEKQIQEILIELSKIQETSSDKKIEKILNNIRKELICLNWKTIENQNREERVWLLRDYQKNYKKLLEN